MIIDIIDKNKLIIIYNNFIEYTEEDNEKEINDNYKYIKNELKVLIKSSKSI
jgi:formaldehyde-activating enzyme involved in methanogenesis